MDDEAQRVEAVYDRYGRSARRAKAWSAANPGNRLIRDEIVEAIAARVGGLASPPGDVLDIGCGSGWWLRRLAELGGSASRLYGIDLLASRTAAASAALPGAEIVHGDARALPWPDRRFWLVTLFLVLSSQNGEASQRRALAEARRVLAPGGHLFVWEPRVPNPANRAATRVRMNTIRRALGPKVESQPVTVLPFLVRRSARSMQAYRRIARFRALRTHRLVHAQLP